MAHSAHKNKPAVTENIIDKIILQPQITEAWLDVLANIACTVRLKQGGSPVVSIGAETAQLTPSGAVNLVSRIGNERIEMGVPSDLWAWKKPPEQTV